jgi:hypothetical protein
VSQSSVFGQAKAGGCRGTTEANIDLLTTGDRRLSPISTDQIFFCFSVIRESVQIRGCFEAKLLGGDGEVYGDAGLGFDRFSRLQIWSEAPLFHCFARGS